MIALDKDGNLAVNDDGELYQVTGEAAQQQFFIAEVRCTQGTFELLPDFGKNPAVWYLSQSSADRADDLIRISKTYLTIKSIQYVNNVYEVTA